VKEFVWALRWPMWQSCGVSSEMHPGYISDCGLKLLCTQQCNMLWDYEVYASEKSLWAMANATELGGFERNALGVYFRLWFKVAMCTALGYAVGLWGVFEWELVVSGDRCDRIGRAREKCTQSIFQTLIQGCDVRSNVICCGIMEGYANENSLWYVFVFTNSNGFVMTDVNDVITNVGLDVYFIVFAGLD